MLNPNETRTFKVFDLNNTELELGTYRINVTLLTNQVPTNCFVSPLNIEIME
jgi:hypothetical protein